MSLPSPINCQYVGISLSVCRHVCLWTELNQETIRNVEYFILQVKSVNMWWSNYFSFSVWMLSPENRFKSRNNWKYWVKIPSSKVCQYVVVRFFLFPYADRLACEQNLMKKQLKLLSIISSNQSLSISGGLILSL